MISLSIIIAAYNAENYIIRAIREALSVKGETEVIVVNDGSKDNTLKICQQLQVEYPNLFVYTQTNSGVSAARNLGIEKARGKWLFFCDADDWVNAKNIESLLCTADNYEGRILLAGVNFITSDGIKYHSVADNKEYSPGEFLNSSNFLYSSWNYIFPSEIIKKNQIRFPVGIVNTEDQNFNIKCIVYSNGIYSRDISVYNYDKRNENAAHRSNKSFKWKIGPLETSLDLIKFCEKQNFSTDLIQVQINRLVEDFYREHTGKKFNEEERSQILIMLGNISQSCVKVKCSPKYKVMRLNSRLGLILIRLYNKYFLKI